jgi:hypothetical protein
MVCVSTTMHSRRYTYYVCYRATRRGWRACPAPSVSGTAAEAFVVRQVERIGDVPMVVEEACRISCQAAMGRNGAETNGDPAGQNGHGLDEARLRRLWAAFPAHWAGLGPHERHELLHQLIERISYDGRRKRISISFRPAGVLAIAEQFAQQEQEER